MGGSELSELESAYKSERFLDTCRVFGVSRLSLFGSLLHGDAGPASDVDLLVEFETPKSLMSLISLENELAEQLGQDVDLLTADSISPHLRDRILEEAKLAYFKG